MNTKGLSRERYCTRQLFTRLSARASSSCSRQFRLVLGLVALTSTTRGVAQSGHQSKLLVTVKTTIKNTHAVPAFTTSWHSALTARLALIFLLQASKNPQQQVVAGLV